MIIDTQYKQEATNTNQVNKTQKNSNESFEENLNNNKAKEESRSTQDLVNDIISLLKTGFTVDELEALQEYIRQLKEQLKEESKKENPNYDEIEKSISQIEKAIAIMKKRLTGQAIIEVSEDANFDKKLQSNSSSKLEDLQNRLEIAGQNIEAFKNTKYKKEGINLSNQEEFKLLEELKYFNKINN